MQSKTRMKPQRHDEHRGKRRAVFSANRPHSVTENRTANCRSSLYYNPSKPSPTARILPSRRRLSDHPSSDADAWLFVPEGRRRRLAGGKPAPAGAAPGCHAERAMPPRGIGEVSGVASLPASPPPAVAPRRSGSQCRIPAAPASDQHPGPFLRCPAGARSSSPWIPGAASAAADLPPANTLRRPSGTETRGPLPERGKPRCGNCLPHSFGCGSAARCSSCLWGSFRAPSFHGST